MAIRPQTPHGAGLCKNAQVDKLRQFNVIPAGTNIYTGGDYMCGVADVARRDVARDVLE